MVEQNKSSILWLNKKKMITISDMGQYNVTESALKALVPCNVWRSGSTKGDCVHFFVSDYMFIGLLNASDDELRELAEARFVITPDFSQYADMPPEQRRHNCLLNRFVAARMQSLGVNIIVNATWSTPDSFAYCFDGLPAGCAIAINSNGARRLDASKYRFAGKPELLGATPMSGWLGNMPKAKA